jgi:predicted dehydrogenase
VEKPFAASTADARRMMKAMEGTGKQMAINWPLRWVESHVTAKRLIDEGMIGNSARGAFLRRQSRPALAPCRQGGGQRRRGGAPEARSWWYKKASGGGSLLDYMGYGATLGTWYMNGRPTGSDLHGG